MWCCCGRLSSSPSEGALPVRGVLAWIQWVLSHPQVFINLILMHRIYTYRSTSKQTLSIHVFLNNVNPDSSIPNDAPGSNRVVTERVH